MGACSSSAPLRERPSEGQSHARHTYGEAIVEEWRRGWGWGEAGAPIAMLTPRPPQGVERGGTKDEIRGSLCSHPEPRGPGSLAGLLLPALLPGAGGGILSEGRAHPEGFCPSP